MKIEIVTPQRHVASDEAEEIYAVGPKGEFCILPGHAHYVSPLALGCFYYRKQGKKHAFAVEGGFVEVVGEQVYVFADVVEKSDEIDIAQAKTSLDQLDKALSQGEAEYSHFDELLQKRQREQVRVQVGAESA